MSRGLATGAVAARAVRRAVLGQAAVYLTTGLWPLVHLRSFEAVTGRKRDDWLVKANGAIFAAIGLGLGLAAVRDRLTPEWRAMAVALAAGVIGVEGTNLARRRISWVYGLDAAFEAAMAVVWLAAGRRVRGGPAAVR